MRAGWSGATSSDRLGAAEAFLGVDRAEVLLDPVKPMHVLIDRRAERADCIGKTANIALDADVSLRQRSDFLVKYVNSARDVCKAFLHFHRADVWCGYRPPGLA